MSKRPGYVGGYIDPAVKEIFVARAEDQGMNITEYLNFVLTDYLEGSTNDLSVQDTSPDTAIFEELSEELQERLNHLLIQAYEELAINEKDSVARYLETLADILMEDMTDPVELDEKGTDMFQEVLSEEMLEEAIYCITRAIEDFDEEAEIEELDMSNVGIDAFFPDLAIVLNNRAEELHGNDQSINLAFSREEMYYLDKMLEGANEASSIKFSSLSTYIRYKLGEHLKELGSGFMYLFNTDEEMVNTGRKMMSEATNQ